jgi:hypothetical protein
MFAISVIAKDVEEDTSHVVEPQDKCTDGSRSTENGST